MFEPMEQKQRKLEGRRPKSRFLKYVILLALISNKN